MGSPRAQLTQFKCAERLLVERIPDPRVFLGPDKDVEKKQTPKDHEGHAGQNIIRKEQKGQVEPPRGPVDKPPFDARATLRIAATNSACV